MQHSSSGTPVVLNFMFICMLQNVIVFSARKNSAKIILITECYKFRFRLLFFWIISNIGTVKFNEHNKLAVIIH